MTTAKKLISAAGAAGAGEVTYVDDVFSTFLYEGNSGSQQIQNGINLGNFGVGTSTRFDGSSDYLDRGGNLTNAADSASFTFSAWVKPSQTAVYQQILGFGTSGSSQKVDIGFGAYIQLTGRASDGTRHLDSYTGSTNPIPAGVWSHILVSIDLSNSSNRKIYVNDVDITSSFTFSNTNGLIDFAAGGTAVSRVGSALSGNSKFAGDLAHVYLDYTYRDLSTTSNRRLFIDANGGSTSPSSLSALSPVLYLPMTTDYAVGKNLGTGGDFSATGSPTIVQSGTEYVADSGKGGLAWFKCRNIGMLNNLFDTVRGNTQRLDSSGTSEQSAQAAGRYPTFTSTGFTLGADDGGDINYSGRDYVSWTFRKAPGFFDIVTYTGNGTAGRTVSHNLGSVPGMLIVKCTSHDSTLWPVYHRANTAAPETDFLRLNDNNATSDYTYWNDTAPTSTEFTLNGHDDVNQTGRTYVAYLFAHDAQDFGTDSDESIIKCGSFTTSAGSDNSTDVTASVNLGFEPQWILMKPASATGDWLLVDVMRGITTPYSDFSYTGNDNFLRANTSGEDTEYGFVNATSTGFNVYRLLGSTEYIYMAIRRPHKPASEFAAADLFNVDLGDANDPGFDTGFPVDMGIFRLHESTADFDVMSRLTGARRLDITTGVEASKPNAMFDYMDGWVSSGMGSHTGWAWRRAPGYFDVVAYTGNGVFGHMVNHNLGVVPEMIWIKNRGRAGTDWPVYHAGNTSEPETEAVYLNKTDATSDSATFWHDTSPTATQFSAGRSSSINNQSGDNYIAYLFASVDGISKVGSYTGTGNDINVDCGFSAGARFVLVKRTDSTGDWYLWDSVRGIVAGNDPYLLLNSDAAQDSSYDYIDPLSSGFTVTSSAPAALNASSGTYLFYAIA